MAHDGVGNELRIAAEHFGISLSDIRSQRRTRTIHPARLWAAYLASVTTDASFEIIGQHMRRDDAVIRMYVRARARDVADNESSARLFAYLTARAQGA